MKHSYGCLIYISANCNCANRSPYEIARDLLSDVYNNAKLSTDGNLTLLPSTYANIKEFLMGLKDERPSV